jgi:uncharacterized OB-fold protein
MIPRNWRLQQQRYRLEGKVCEHCHKVVFPPRSVCIECATSTRVTLFAGFVPRAAALVRVQVVQTAAA